MPLDDPHGRILCQFYNNTFGKRMFSFLKKRKVLSREEYQERYLSLRKEMAEPFLEHTTSVQQKLISSVSVLDKEWNHNGGVNWSHDGFEEYLEALNEHLLDSETFTEKEKRNEENALREASLASAMLGMEEEESLYSESDVIEKIG